MGWASRGGDPSKNHFSLSPVQVAPAAGGGSFHQWGTRIEISPDLPVDANVQNTSDQRSDYNKTQPVICNSAS